MLGCSDDDVSDILRVSDCIRFWMDQERTYNSIIRSDFGAARALGGQS